MSKSTGTWKLDRGANFIQDQSNLVTDITQFDKGSIFVYLAQKT